MFFLLYKLKFDNYSSGDLIYINCRERRKKLFLYNLGGVDEGRILFWWDAKPVIMEIR